MAVDSQVLHYAPVLRAVGRLSSGAENIDTDACARAGVEVVRPINASAAAEFLNLPTNAVVELGSKIEI